jgi:hypothetical protein
MVVDRVKTKRGSKSAEVTSKSPSPDVGAERAAIVTRLYRIAAQAQPGAEMPPGFEELRLQLEALG